MTVHAEERLKQLGISLPKAGSPAAKYANYVIVNVDVCFRQGSLRTAEREARGALHNRAGV